MTVLGMLGGVFVGICACAGLHWLFPGAASTTFIDAAVTATCGIVGLALDVRRGDADR